MTRNLGVSGKSRELEDPIVESVVVLFNWFNIETTNTDKGISGINKVQVMLCACGGGDACLDRKSLRKHLGL